MYNLKALHSLLLYCLILIFTIISQVVKSQTVWGDTFNDSNFTSQPTWIGDTSNFIVNDSLNLQLSAPPVSGNASLFATSTAAWTGTWTFRVILKFNPSSNNYAKVYFMHSKQTSNSGFGYFVRIGGSSSDRISLYRQSGSSEHLLIDSDADIVDQPESDLTVQVSRNTLGLFELSIDSGNGFFSVGQAIDKTHLHSSFFGWSCFYTSTRSDKFYLDDIQVMGIEFKDSIPPKVIDLSILNSRELNIRFSESLDSNLVFKPGVFNLNNDIGFPSKIIANSRLDSFNLQFENSMLPDSNYNLIVQEVEDLFGNEITDTSIAFNFHSEFYGYVTISEVMFDPSPPVLLPEVEYLELFNNSGSLINLENWKIKSGSKVVTLPSIELLPDSFMLVADTFALSHFSTKNKVGVYWPTGFLPNSGQKIELINDLGVLIFSIEYSPSQFSNPAKSEGGWSLERNDTRTTCFSPSIWDGSKDQRGGTPGSVNSITEIYSDINPPVVQAVKYKSPTSIALHFSEAIENPFFNCTLSIENVAMTNFSSISVLTFSTAMLAMENYRLIISNGKDCQGNKMAPDTVVFGIPSFEYSDLKINEIMFDPDSESEEFIELYNTSNRCVSLSHLNTAKINPMDSLPENVYSISRDTFLIPPLSYFVLSPDPQRVFSKYPNARRRFFFECEMPTLTNSEGSIGVCNRSLEWIDRAFYREDWHHPIFTNTQGISLERVNPFVIPDQNNWHSASFTAGYATPGLKNSQFMQNVVSNRIEVFPKIFSPDNDGQSDLLGIFINMEQPGWALTLMVYDAYGNEVKSLFINKPIGVQETIWWDGTDNNNRLQKRGSYIIFADLWHANGNRQIVKKGVSLNYR